MRSSERKQIIFTAAICLMVASLVYTPLARVHAGSALQQTNTNRPVIRIGKPAAKPAPAPTPTPRPTLQGNSNRPAIRIGGAARAGGNSNANTNANTNSGGPAQRRDTTGPLIRREANSNRGLIRIGNANSKVGAATIPGAGANSNRPAVTNSNRNSGRQTGGIVGPDRTNANSSSPDTNSSSPNTGGPTLGGSRLAAHVSLSPKVDAELRRMNRLTSAPRAAFAVPQRAQGMAQVALFNEKDAFGIFECDKAQGKDDLALEETADHIIVSFRCANSRNAMDRMATRDSNRLAIAFRKAEIKSTFTAQKSGATYGPTAAGMMRVNSPARKLLGDRLPEGVSRDDFEMANCLSAFRRFRDEPGMRYFRVRFAARVYRCEVDMSRANYEMRNSGLFAGLATRGELPTVSANSPLADLRLRSTGLAQIYDPDYKGTKDSQTLYHKASSMTDKPDEPLPNYVFPGEPEFFNFVFAFNGQPGFSKVAFQLAYSQTILPPKGSACDGWETPGGFIRQRLVTPAYEPLPPGTGLRANGKGTGQLGSVRVKPSDITDGLMFKPEVTVYARAVPLGGKNASRCMGGPSPWVKIVVSNPRAKYLAEQERKKREQELYEKFLAERAKIVGTDNAGHQAHSPIRISVISYIPPLKVDNNLVAYNLSEMEWRGVSGFNLSPVYGWPKRDWPSACMFDAEELLVAATAYKELPDDALEWIIYVFDQASLFYSQWQTIIVDTFSFLLSGAECDGKSEPAACAPLRTGLRTGLRYALAAAGLPPSIPNIAGLLDQANSQVATEAVDFALSQFPAGDIGGLAKDVLREALVDQTKELLRQWSQTLRCNYPVPPGRTPQERHANAVAMGYEGVNGNGCGQVAGDLDPYEWSTKNTGVRDRPGIVYLKIERNNSPGALHLSKNQWVQIEDANKYYLPASLRIQVDNIPQGGVILPVVLNPDVASAASKANINTDCSTPGGLASCTDEGLQRSLWANAWGKNVEVDLSIHTHYKWTDTAPPGGKEAEPVKVFWGGLKRGIQEQKGTHGQYDMLGACPGFKYETIPGPLGNFIVGTVNDWH